jgi:hypothetical protein
MNTTINIYCDESCHLPNDGQKAMVLGALWCFKGKVAEHHRAIAALKAKHNLSPFFEIKWTKVSPGKLNFYKKLIEYFFDSRTMGFRAWVIPDKSLLSHDKHDQTHDEWYYKMYFYLLRNLISTERKHHIYLDIKDTLQKSEALCQSILKKAFSGKLVPQDPNDEPASVLLEWIAAEKAKSTTQNLTRPGG